MIVSALIFLLLVISIWWNVKKPANFPPGPRCLPLIGNFTQFRKRLAVLGYHHLVWNQLAAEYGSVVGLRLGRNLVVTVSGLEAVKEVLIRDEFNGRPDGFFFRMRTFGKRLGIVFSDGKLWQRQRKFSMQHLRNFGLGKRDMELRIADECTELIKLLKEKSKEPIFLHNAFDICVLNVLWAMMAGERFTLDDIRLEKLLQIIHDAFRIVDMAGGVLNQMPFLRYFAPNACGYTQLCDILTRLWKFLDETITEHRKTVCSSHARDLIDAFLQQMSITNACDPTFTDEQLLSLCLDLLMAGSETTSNTLGFAMLYMLEYQDVQQLVQKELDTVVGRNRWPTVQDKINLPYTEAVLMEIQRIANIPPLGIAHRAVCNTKIFNYDIPVGTIVLTSLYSVHMDSKFWKNPDEFRPERFLDHNGKLSVPEWHFLPFGYGKRRCLGESLAKANYYLFFTALLHNFHVEKDHFSSKPTFDGYDGVTISPRPFKAKLTFREE